MIKVCPSSSFYSTPVLISGADLTCILRAKKKVVFQSVVCSNFFLICHFFCRSSETRPPEDDEEEEEEILGSDDDEQEDPKDYVKGKNIIFRLNFTHYTYILNRWGLILKIVSFHDLSLGSSFSQSSWPKKLYETYCGGNQCCFGNNFLKAI